MADGKGGCPEQIVTASVAACGDGVGIDDDELERRSRRQRVQAPQLAWWQAFAFLLLCVCCEVIEMLLKSK